MQPGDLFGESEGARRGELLTERLGAEGKRERLGADGRRGEDDGERHVETRTPRGGKEGGLRLAMRDLHRGEDLDRLAGRVLFGDAGAIDEEDEGGGGAIENRHFRPVHLDQRVVDAEPGERRHDVLDGADARLGDPGEADLGGKPRFDHRIEAGGDGEAEIGAAENDPVPGGSGLEDEACLAPRMQAHAHTADFGFQGALAKGRADPLLLFPQRDPFTGPCPPVGHARHPVPDAGDPDRCRLRFDPPCRFPTPPTHRDPSLTGPVLHAAVAGGEKAAGVTLQARRARSVTPVKHYF